MDNDIRNIQVLFNDQANDCFQVMYGNFCKSSKSIDRNRKENEYQLLRHKYATQLDQNLNAISQVLISRCDRGTQRELSIWLKRTSSYFISEFMQKTDKG